MLEKASALGDELLDELLRWSSINTGSWNREGLDKFAPILAKSFSCLGGKIEMLDAKPIESVNAAGEKIEFQTAPIVKISKREDAPIQVVFTGHYDTVFPPGEFEDIKHLSDGRINGPGLADMKGGLIVMREALRLFEETDQCEHVGYQIVISPDEEIGNFASAGHIEDAAKKAHIGLTYEPAMEDGSLAGARKASAVYDIIFEGRAAHAGREKLAGRSAIAAAAEFCVAVERLNDPDNDALTFNVGAIEGGGPVNIVPDLAVLRMGARAKDARHSTEADQKIRAYFDQCCQKYEVTGRIEGGFYRPAKPRNLAQDALIEAIRSTGTALGLSLNFKDTGGVCEGNNVFAAGTPNIDTLGVRGGRIHSSDEFLIPESLSERIALSAFMLNRIADNRIDAIKIKDMMKSAVPTG